MSVYGGLIKRVTYSNLTIGTPLIAKLYIDSESMKGFKQWENNCLKRVNHVFWIAPSASPRGIERYGSLFFKPTKGGKDGRHLKGALKGPGTCSLKVKGHKTWCPSQNDRRQLEPSEGLLLWLQDKRKGILMGTACILRWSKRRGVSLRPERNSIGRTKLGFLRMTLSTRAA